MKPSVELLALQRRLMAARRPDDDGKTVTTDSISFGAVHYRTCGISDATEFFEFDSRRDICCLPFSYRYPLKR